MRPLIDILEETVREMIVAQYKENAADKIDEIQALPSESELQTMKDMILSAPPSVAATNCDM